MDERATDAALVDDLPAWTAATNVGDGKVGVDEGRQWRSFAILWKSALRFRGRCCIRAGAGESSDAVKGGWMCGTAGKESQSRLQS